MRRILHDRSGQFAMMFGLCLPVLLLSAGIAVDTSRLTAAKTSLQNSVDAALMAASRFNGDDDRSREDYFDQYLAATIASDPFLANLQTDFNADIGANYIRTSATASAGVSLTIMDIFTGQPATVSVDADAYEATDALEVVMVLDNTGSMRTNDRIGALRTAATTLVETLETVAENNPNRRIRMALVPFVTAANVRGAEFDCSWIDVNALAQFHGANFDPVAIEYDADGRPKDAAFRTETGGPCPVPAVASLEVGEDEDDDHRGPGKGGKRGRGKGPGPGKCNGVGNDKPGHNGNCDTGSSGDDDEPQVESVQANHLRLFDRIGVEWKGCVEARPRSVSLDAVPSAGNPDTLFVPYFAPDEPDKDQWNGNRNTPLAGDNSQHLNTSYLTDQATGDHATVQRSVAKYNEDNPALPLRAQPGPLTGGPNRACPTPIVPLTSDFDVLKTAVSQMIQWNGSGTNVSEGLAWGTRVLSPEAPYMTADPFNTEGTKKVVVLLTDGENVVYGASKTDNGSDYGSYGYLASNRFGSTNQNSAARAVDGWTKENCTMLKNNGVEIYTVLLQADNAANRALYSGAGDGCASTPENYFPTNDVSKLESVFAQIANMVADLHFTN